MIPLVSLGVTVLHRSLIYTILQRIASTDHSVKNSEYPPLLPPSVSSHSRPSPGPEPEGFARVDSLGEGSELLPTFEAPREGGGKGLSWRIRKASGGCPMMMMEPFPATN